MRAIVFDKFGPPDVLYIEERDPPVPSDAEVLVRVEAATVAKADCEVRSRSFTTWLQIPAGFMFGFFKPKIRTLGQELAGTIEAVGSKVDSFNSGDKIFAAIDGFGAHAEWVCLPATSAIAKRPPGMTAEQGTCLSVFALNALHFIRLSQIHPGNKVLINGAAGSIGTHAVQLARNLGAEVTAVDSADQLEMLKSIGAFHTIDYQRQDFTKSGDKYDVILDVIGLSPYGRSLKALKSGGRYILANPMFMPMLRSFFTSLISDKQVKFRFASYAAEDLVELARLFSDGKLTPVIDKVFKMEDIQTAHRYIDQGRKQGNVIIRIT